METTHGLLLQSIPYLGKKKILKVLAPELGLISLITSKHAPAPFCIGEWVYKKAQREIFSLQECSILDPLLHLRNDYTTLSAAGFIAQDLLHTQFPNKRAPYALAYAYLKKLPENPAMLAASFRLKLLIHEGLLSPDEEIFSAEEWEQVAILAFSREFSQIIRMEKAPIDKIGALFSDRMSRA